MTHDFPGLQCCGWSLALLGALAASASAQTLGGTVVDQITRRPARGVLVSLHDRDSTVTMTHTDSTGIFYLSPPRSGTYRLAFGGDEGDQFVVDSIAIRDDEFIQRSFAIPIIYAEFEVETEVQQIPAPGVLRFPDDLRQRNISGEVLAQFIVEPSGVVRPGSLRIIRSTNAGFSNAVATALPRFRFLPATIAAVAVPQLVRQPFTFTIEGGDASPCIPGDDLVHAACQKPKIRP